MFAFIIIPVLGATLPAFVYKARLLQKQNNKS
jgi:hypothetical protein